MSTMLHATIITLFPDMFPGPLGYSLIGRALEEGKWSYNTINLRDFGVGKHRNVDDTPYGGGAGMVLRADVVDAAIQTALKQNPDAQIIYFTPRGRVMNQEVITEIANDCHLGSPQAAAGSGSRRSIASRDDTKHLILLCGRFEAVDQRVINKYQPLELSLGDFVMTGGELAAMALLDTAIRLLPGVVGEADSLEEESFGLAQDYACLLEYPHYTAPPDWEGMSVPEVLKSGHHGKIAQWRKAQAESITQERRPSLWKKYTANTED